MHICLKKIECVEPKASALAAIRKVLERADVKVENSEKAKIVIVKNKDFSVKPSGGTIGLLTAGTSDILVAEEAKLIAQEMGCS